MTHISYHMPEAIGETPLSSPWSLRSRSLCTPFWQRRFRSEALRKHNDVAGFLFSAVGVIYAVVLGFVVVVVWEKYDTTVSNVDTEIAAVSDLYRVAGGLAEPTRSRVRNQLTTYANGIVQSEWPQMSQRLRHPEGSDRARRPGARSRRVRSAQRRSGGRRSKRP